MPGAHAPVRDDPVFWTDVVQLVKTVAAAVIAWLLATRVLDLPQSFLAPWAALLVVHSTVYRTFSAGCPPGGAAVLGVLVAWAVGNLFGLGPTAVAVALRSASRSGRCRGSRPRRPRSRRRPSSC